MFLPTKVDVPMARMPWANWVLIAVTSLISLSVFMQALHDEFNPREPRLSPATLKRLQEIQAKGDWQSEEAKKLMAELEAHDEDPGDTFTIPGALDPARFSVSQLISYQFVHGDLLHLIGNMFMLFIFGNAVNAKLGQFTYVLCYLVLGMIGGLGWLLLGTGGPMVGASGAIMGILGIFLILFPRNDVTVAYWGYGAGGSFEISSYWLILFYMGADLVGFIRAAQGIAYVTHLAGQFCGAALAVTFVLTGFVKSTPYEQNALEALGLMPEHTPTRKRKRKKKKRLRRADDNDE